MFYRTPDSNGKRLLYNSVLNNTFDSTIFFIDIAYCCTIETCTLPTATSGLVSDMESLEINLYVPLCFIDCDWLWQLVYIHRSCQTFVWANRNWKESARHSRLFSKDSMSVWFVSMTENFTIACTQVSRLQKFVAPLNMYILLPIK